MLFGRRGPGAGYERLLVVQRPALGLRAIIAVHSTRRGPAFGGIRRKRYASEGEALTDALELAEAMSHKCALAGLSAGGAKTVVLDEGDTADWSAAYEALGAEIEGLTGSYVCGPDLGTGARELAAVRRTCAHVNPEGNDAGVSTAAGVHAGLRAVWRALGSSPAAGRTVAIQGLGSVGRALARALREEGVVVLGADLEPDACRAAAALGVRIVDPSALLSEPCDVLMPCAGGHVLEASTIERLRCRAVCGSANNQLATPSDAARLRDRGILHAPDVVVSAGAVIEGVLTVQHGSSDAWVRARVRETIAGIEGTLASVLDEAARRGLPPSLVARERGQGLTGST
ncbi:Glu/Leu/Phe/Val dehydrogenase dimerization domain-containing protein [Paraliomyxa miuraensis]|uniref:Glu/Leu/Phe/Val dehydrogenase dimerization domain-containing protein n=1 Tax=Paraliomyxa miuraensis TaxID=376150 RepID=UPI0022561B69|nr:Glu/Leu/Phe/Val dehydrogenase dimerization domain-containing protein [Paraliomyxa miuraensis]MCX4240116.1 leucine dehydrogenase [Paraliomyxa miuraensis]